MATREELKDPDFVPYEMELRWLGKDGEAPRLQQFQSRTGWADVGMVHASEAPTGDATPNARNA